MPCKFHGLHDWSDLGTATAQRPGQRRKAMSNFVETWKGIATALGRSERWCRYMARRGARSASGLQGRRHRSSEPQRSRGLVVAPARSLAADADADARADGCARLALDRVVVIGRSRWRAMKRAPMTRPLSELRGPVRALFSDVDGTMTTWRPDRGFDLRGTRAARRCRCSGDHGDGAPGRLRRRRS